MYMYTYPYLMRGEPRPAPCVVSPSERVRPLLPVKRSTGHTHTYTTAEQITHTNTERATAQRRLIVEVVVAAPQAAAQRCASAPCECVAGRSRPTPSLPHSGR